MVLTKCAKGTELGADRGILSDYMTILNGLIDHVRRHYDEINSRTNDVAIASNTDLYLKTCIVNCWTKLDDYFIILNNTPAHYAFVVTAPYIKWKYFEYMWKDAKD
jgi:hypothetical protein